MTTTPPAMAAPARSAKTLLGYSQKQLYTSAIIASAYNRKRQAFFERWYYREKFLTLLTATTSFTGLIPEKPPAIFAFIAPWSMAFFIALTISTIVWRFGELAHLHGSLAERWDLLSARLASPLSSAELFAADAELCNIGSKEPAPLRLLLAICQIEHEQTVGVAPSAEITWFHRLIADYIDCEPPKPI